jgi:hypothetical protein
MRPGRRVWQMLSRDGVLRRAVRAGRWYAHEVCRFGEASFLDCIWPLGRVLLDFESVVPPLMLNGDARQT